MQHESSGSEPGRVGPPVGAQTSVPSPTLKRADSSEATVTQLMNDTKITNTASSAHASPKTPPEQSSAPAEVLIVDDNPINRNVSSMLSKHVAAY